EPENAISGIALTAADCAGLHRRRSPQEDGGLYHTRWPPERRSANMPPPRLGSASVLLAKASMMRPRSEFATYTLVPSTAAPHCTPPCVPPCPTRPCHRTLPCSP